MICLLVDVGKYRFIPMEIWCFDQCNLCDVVECATFLRGGVIHALLYTVDVSFFSLNSIVFVVFPVVVQVVEVEVEPHLWGLDSIREV